MRKRVTGLSCCACGAPFAAHYEEKPYCNKHYLRMKLNGTLELRGRKRTSTVVDNGDGSATVTTAKGQIILIDASDRAVAERYSWCVSKTGYAVANTGNRVVKMHRYILGVNDPEEIIDHINGNRLDNRRKNLRRCTAKENSRNLKLKVTNNSGYAGIRETEHGTYNVRITFQRKEIHIGNYKSYEEAVNARKEAERRFYGEFAPCITQNTEM